MAREALQLFKAGRLEQALPTAQGAVAIARVCSPEHALLACVLHGLGRIEEACAAVNDALNASRELAETKMAAVTGGFGLPMCSNSVRPGTSD